MYAFLGVFVYCSHFQPRALLLTMLLMDSGRMLVIKIKECLDIPSKRLQGRSQWPTLEM
jgi:hypothetical protein